MLDMIKGFFSTKLSPEQQIALRLYEHIVRAARQQPLYERGGVPDTLEGRVEAIGFHAFLLFRRMSGETGWDEIGGALSDEIVADFDRSLRELGIGDMSIGKKVKFLAQALFSRFDSYWGAVKGSEGADDLPTLLRRDLYQGGEVSDAQVEAMLSYFDRQSAYLFTQDAKDILKGRVDFSPPDPDFAALPSVLEAADADQGGAA